MLISSASFLTPFLDFEIRNLAFPSLCPTTSLSLTIAYPLPTGCGPAVVHFLSANITKNKKELLPFSPPHLRIFQQVYTFKKTFFQVKSIQ